MSWCGTGAQSLCAFLDLFLTLRVCHKPRLHTCVTPRSVLMLECVSGLRAISSPVSISILYSFYLQPSEAEGLFFFVSDLVQQLSDITSVLYFFFFFTAASFYAI